MSGVGVCITGLQRTLLHPAVPGTFDRRVVQPLRASGNVVDTFIVLVANWSASSPRNASAVRAAVEAAFTPTVLLLLQARHVAAGGRNGSCTVHGSTAIWAKPWQRSRAELTPRSYNLGHANKTLTQYVAIRECFRAVCEHEELRRAPYKWLLRTRTDLVFLQTLHLPDNATFVYVPRDGMNIHPLALCTNDHMFLCPRHLCRPYFMLAELWESPYCRRDGRAAATPGSTPFLPADESEPAHALASIIAHADADAPGGFWTPREPKAPFLLPALPPMADAQWYWMARYGGAGPCDARRTTDAKCCGLVREMPFMYDLARDRSPHFILDCKHHDIRISFASSLMPIANATDYARATADCRKLASQAKSAVGIAEWHAWIAMRAEAPEGGTLNG